MSDVRRTSTNFHLYLQDGDPHAWEEFYLVYFDMMICWAREFGCTAAEARELAQAKTVQLFSRNRFTSFRSKGPYSFRRWLKRVVVNEACSFLRKARRFMALGFLGADELQNLVDGEKEAKPHNDGWTDDDWSYYRRCLVNRALRSSLAQRQPKEGQAFVRRVIGREEAVAVAEDLGVARDVFDVYIGRFRKHLSGELKRLLDDDKNYLGSLDDVFDEAELLRVLDELGDCSEDFDTLLEEQKKGDEPSLEIRSILRLMDEMPPPDPERESLLVFNGETREWRGLTDGMTIGRAAKADVLLTGKGVSSLHASIHHGENGWLLRDENSTNHVYLNHNRVVREAYLIPGDWFQISDWCLVYIGRSDAWVAGVDLADDGE